MNSNRVREAVLVETQDDTGRTSGNIVESFLPNQVSNQHELASALIPWVCDVLRSKRSIEAYGHDLRQFLTHASELGVAPFMVTADHVKVFKAHLLSAGFRPASVARKLSVIRGAYREFAEKGFIDWRTSEAISNVKSPPVPKNATPALTSDQAVTLLDAVPTDTLQGVRDLAMLETLFITGCRVSAICAVRVGDLEFNGAEHFLHMTDKRGRESRKLLLDVADSIFRYVDSARIQNDREGPLFRPLAPDGNTLLPRHMSRGTPWRLVKKYCARAGIDPNRLTGRGICVHSLRKTAITDAIRNGANMHEVREFAGHSDIRTTELYYVRREEDAEQAARRIQIRGTRTCRMHS